MKTSALWLVAVTLLVTGCSFSPNGAKIGGDAQHVAVDSYPNATNVSNGENNQVIGLTFDSDDPKEQVQQFYAAQLGVPAAGVMKGNKGGHEISIIVTNGAKARTSVSIVEKKS